MRKFLIPVINLVNIILVSITFGLAANTAAYDVQLTKNVAMGNWYQMVWTGSYGGANVIGLVSFFLFVVAVALVVATFIPFKCRKYTLALTGAMFIAAGVLFLMTPNGLAKSFSDGVNSIDRTGSLIAMAVLVFCAGAFSMGAAAIDFVAKEDK